MTWGSAVEARQNDPRRVTTDSTEALSDPLERASDLHVRWWRGQDLNLRPLGYEPNELPDCSTPRRLGVDGGPYRRTPVAATCRRRLRRGGLRRGGRGGGVGRGGGAPLDEALHLLDLGSGLGGLLDVGGEIAAVLEGCIGFIDEISPLA